MTYSHKIGLSFAAGLLALAVLGLPQQASAQRFNHSSFGGGGGGRAWAPPMHTEAPRPSAPVMRPAPAAPRPAPPVQENRTINGGSRNFGNHDFHPNPVNAPQQRITVRDHERVNVYHTGGYRGLHPYTYHPYHPFYWGPRWHPAGFFAPYIAADAFRFYLGSQWYYYDDGCYYVPSQGGYSSVPPPVGAMVSYLPDGYETTMVGNDTYYYYAGAFYINAGEGYQVVRAPIGAVVSQLPVGAADQQVNGEDLLVYNNVYYQPISQDGQDAYEVVQSN